MELEQPCQLFSKEGFTFSKQTKNHYTLSFYMENKHYVLSKLIDFHLVKLIYDLNNDIYEDIHFNIIDDQHATIALLMKPLFEDLGMPQRFSNLYITKVIHQSEDSHTITFLSSSVNERPPNIPAHAQLMPIQSMKCHCQLITEHKMHFTCYVVFEDKMIVPAVAEKLIGLILYKVFKRVRCFIENVH